MPVRDDAWCRTDIDQFVLARLKAASIVPNSTAAQAGLRVGDRIYEVDGQPADSDHLKQLMRKPDAETIQLLLERKGALMEAAI